VKLVIPWNNLKTKEITAEISNAKIVISNKIEMSNFNKEQYKEHIEKLKKEILAKFDENVAKEDSFSNGSQGSSFFTDFVIKVLGKFVLKINNLDIIFIY
jgi:vacuolar protein sorting-associated protein 13A/C